MCIWTANKFVKFHTRRLKWSENIRNSLRGLLFLKHPARVKVMSYQASGPVYFGPPWLMQSDTDPHQHADKRPRAGRNGQWCTQDDGPVAYTGPVGQWRIQDEHKPYECKHGGVRLTTLAPWTTTQPASPRYVTDLIKAGSLPETLLMQLQSLNVDSGGWHGAHDIVVIVVTRHSRAGQQRHAPIVVQHSQDVAVVDRHGVFAGRRRSTTGTHVTHAPARGSQQRHHLAVSTHQHHVSVSTAAHTGRQHAALDWTPLRYLCSQ